MGFSIFSKVQIAPAILFYGCGAAGFLIFLSIKGKLTIQRSHGAWAMVVGLLNLVLMPWWAFRKPAFITEKFRVAMEISVDYKRTYGLAPEYIGQLPLTVLLVLLILSGCFYFLFFRPKPGPAFKGGTAVLLFMHSTILGFILSAYLIFLPISTSLSRYIENTQHLLYAVMTHYLYRGFLLNKHVDTENLISIFNGLGYSPISGIGLGYFVLTAVVVSMLRLYLKSTPNKLDYIPVLLWFCLGFMMDILATFRSHTSYFVYYTIYSITFYLIGLVLWMKGEGTIFKQQERKLKFLSALPIVFFALLSFHTIERSWNFLTLPKARAESSQDPMVEYEMTIYHAAPFWEVVQRNIEKELKTIATHIKPGMQRREVEAWFKKKEGGLQGYRINYTHPEIFVEVPYKTAGISPSEDDIVSGTVSFRNENPR